MHISIHANRNLTIAGYVLCAFGGVLFIFMLLGLFGSSYSNQCLLGSYVTCLVVILLVKVSHSNSRIFIPWLACVDMTRMTIARHQPIMALTSIVKMKTMRLF